jgi:hypothetical protein
VMSAVVVVKHRGEATEKKPTRWVGYEVSVDGQRAECWRDVVGGSSRTQVAANEERPTRWVGYKMQSCGRQPSSSGG